MATRLISVGSAIPDGAPIMIMSRSAKYLAGFWASITDYLPGFCDRQGTARLDPQRDDLPLIRFTEDPNESATGTAAMTIEADDLEADAEALLRYGATLVQIDTATQVAEMTDPEGNPFTMVARAPERGHTA